MQVCGLLPATCVLAVGTGLHILSQEATSKGGSWSHSQDKRIFGPQTATQKPHQEQDTVEELLRRGLGYCNAGSTSHKYPQAAPLAVKIALASSLQDESRANIMVLRGMQTMVQGHRRILRVMWLALVCGSWAPAFATGVLETEVATQACFTQKTAATMEFSVPSRLAVARELGSWERPGTMAACPRSWQRQTAFVPQPSLAESIAALACFRQPDWTGDDCRGMQRRLERADSRFARCIAVYVCQFQHAPRHRRDGRQDREQCYETADEGPPLLHHSVGCCAQAAARHSGGYAVARGCMGSLSPADSGSSGERKCRSCSAHGRVQNEGGRGAIQKIAAARRQIRALAAAKSEAEDLDTSEPEIMETEEATEDNVTVTTQQAQNKLWTATALDAALASLPASLPTGGEASPRERTPRRKDQKAEKANPA